MSKTKRLTVSTITEDGKRTLSGVFRLVDSQGIPLTIVLHHLRDHGCMPDWIAFWEDAMSARWPPQRAWMMLSTAVREVFGATFYEGWELRMKAYLEPQRQRFERNLGRYGVQGGGGPAY